MKTVKKSFLFFCILTGNLAIILLLHTACSETILDDCIEGAGNTIRIDRNIGAFSQIEVNGDADVIFIQSDEASLKLEGQENILNVLTTGIRGNCLVIGYDECVINHEKVTVYISNPLLTSLNMNGSANFLCNDTIRAENLHTTLSGSGNIDIRYLDSPKLSTSVNGSGAITITGAYAATDFVANINGSGNIHCSGFPADSVEISINGSGNCYAYPTEILVAHIFGSGNIYYEGDPAIYPQIQGAGKLIRL